MKLNNKGYVPLQMFLVMGLIAGLTGTATVKTASDGTLKKHMNVIGCKMANNDADFCNAAYGYVPKDEAIEKNGGGLRARILAWQGK